MTWLRLFTPYFWVDVQRFHQRILIIFLFILIISAGISAVAAVDVTGPLVITAPGTYILRNDILNSNVPVCINITSPDVIFEGSRYTIDGRDSANSIGIYLYNASTPPTNVTITNVTVRDWNYGIYVRESQEGRIENVTIESATTTTGQGLLLRSASGYDIVNCTLRSNPYGINLTSSNDNTITGVTATANTYGIYLTSSHRNTLTANNLSSNTNTSLYFLGSHDNTIVDTTANSNTNNGCYFSVSSNNTLDHTTANNNAYGIILSSSTNNALSSTTVNSNTNTGLQLLSSNTTTVSGTIANWNRNYGVLLTTSTNNTLNETTALGNQYGVYLTGSSNNTLSGTTASSNTNTGVYLTSSPRNILNGATAMSNQYGFYLTGSNTTTIIAATASSNTNYGMYLSTSGNATLYGNSVNSNTNMGIYLSASDACTITANRADSNTNYGIRLVSSARCTLTNNTANNNLYGISLSSSSDNQIINSTVSNNINSGLHLATSHGNTLEETVATSNTNIGIYLDRSNNNTLLRGSSTGNTYAGIYLTTATNNTLQEINTSSNTYGIYFTSTSNSSLIGLTGNRNTNSAIYLASSNDNALNNSSLSENTNFGIYLSSSRRTTIYNNYLNNTNNLGIGGTLYGNTWNVSKTPGTSIVEGSFLGGNFWGKPDWSGFSQTAPDADGDGICDSSYTLGTGNIDYLPLHRPLPVANFSANVTSGPVPLSVSFNDTSTGSGIALWFWDFGDGTTSISQNLIHTFDVPGAYEVRLQVTNDGGSDWENRTDFITVTNQTPVANFSANVTSGPVPLSVSFNDTSTGSGIALWFWDFGDGTTSDVKHPVHLYTIPGTFNVSLYVRNDGGWDWENRTAYITVNPHPTPIPRTYIRISGGAGTTGGVITLYADHIHSGEEYAFITGESVPVSSIGICPRETVRDVFLYLERIFSLPEDIPYPPSEVYGYFTVTLTGSPYCSLEYAHIDFIVPKNWMSEHGVATDEIELGSYWENHWISLPAECLSEYGDRVLYRATTRDLSHVYAIMGRTHPTLTDDGNTTSIDILPLRQPLNSERGAGFPLPLSYLYLIGYGIVMFSLGFVCKTCLSGRNNSR